MTAFSITEVGPSPVRKKFRYVCPKCSGRGWAVFRGPNDWPMACAFCAGGGGWSERGLARRLRVSRDDVRAVRCLRSGAVRGDRVLEAIARVFPEALSC